MATTCMSLMATGGWDSIHRYGIIFAPSLEGAPPIKHIRVGKSGIYSRYTFDRPRLVVSDRINHVVFARSGPGRKFKRTDDVFDLYKITHKTMGEYRDIYITVDDKYLDQLLLWKLTLEV